MHGEAYTRRESSKVSVFALRDSLPSTRYTHSRWLKLDLQRPAGAHRRHSQEAPTGSAAIDQLTGANYKLTRLLAAMRACVREFGQLDRQVQTFTRTHQTDWPCPLVLQQSTLVRRAAAATTMCARRGASAPQQRAPLLHTCATHPQPCVKLALGMLMTVVLSLHIIASELTTPWLPMPDCRKPWNGKWSGPLAGGPLTCTT